MLRRALWLTAAPPLALLLGACGSSAPSSQSLIQRTSQVMAQRSYQLVGSTRAGQTQISFSVKTLPDGDFSGQVDTVVPHSPTLTTDVVALGSKVYVLSPMALAQLGIAALPGHLNPATTWVLQPVAVAARYRHSLAAFTGPPHIPGMPVGESTQPPLISNISRLSLPRSPPDPARVRWPIRIAAPTRPTPARR